MSRLEEERRKANESHAKIWSRAGGLFGFGFSGSSRELYSSTCIPAENHLQVIIEKAFWASLQKEEGRTLHFSIGYGQPSRESDYDLLFDERLPYDVSHLVKLAPAAGAAESAIAVGISDDGLLQVWGIKTVALTPLQIKVLDPGLLILSFSIYNVAIISGDEAVFVRDTLLSRSSSIWSKLQGAEGGDDFNPFADPRVPIILDTLRSMRALGHGGTLLIVPDESLPRPIDHIAYAANPRLKRINNLLKQLADEEAKEKKERDEELREALKSLLRRSAKELARLTTVDGATIVNNSLDVIGFGAKIKEGEQATRFDITEIDPLEHEGFVSTTPVEKFGGKRH